MLEQKQERAAALPREAEKKAIKALQKELAALQQPLRAAGVPVLLVFEGWSAAGKGSMIAKVISEMDPRGYQVYSAAEPTDEEARRPLLWPFWRDLPPRGEAAVLDRSWYGRVLEQMEAEHGRAGALLESVNIFERQLGDDGYLILKFFLHISQGEQKKRLEKLSGDPATAWRVTDRDWRRNRDYRRHLEAADLLLEATDTPHAPWHVIWNEEKGTGTLEVLTIIRDALAAAVREGAPRPVPAAGRRFPLREVPPLSAVDLSPKVSDEDYHRELKKEKKKLQRLHSALYREKVPVVIGFEGWDAAGKGGAIRRLSWALDPRGFDVVPIAAPTPDALARHYLWRFWRELPKNGHVVLFDRTWYGRVMVERIEGLTSEVRWRQAYDEINAFEKELSDWGAVVLKFWLQIDPDEQLRRFTARQETPEKQYKITDEDWRNRVKWDRYAAALDEMLQKTSTEYAPWVIVESNDKKYARLKVLKTVRKALERRLED